MHLEKLSLLNFKNFKAVDFAPAKGINCISGKNGTGKTNLLDAIYYLSFCKSYFNSIDMQNINDSEDFFMIQGKYLLDDKKEVLSCSVKIGEKKVFKRNDKIYNRLADHIGLFPLVIISPSDIDYINEGSAVRRKYIDSVLVQFDKVYLDNLINYNKALTQRNFLLKRFYERNYFDKQSLEVWDSKLIILGQKIFEKRLAFIEDYIPVFQEFYNKLSGGHEVVSVEYKSQLTDGQFSSTFRAALKQDMRLQYTTVGVHKDDLLFTISDKPLKKFGSQGQQKTFLVALKLAQYKLTKKLIKIAPLLLLDDIFDKLDSKRVSHLIKLVNDYGFEQVMITDTEYERQKSVLNQVNLPAKFFKVGDAKVEEIV